MSSPANVTPIHEPGTALRRARGAHVKNLMEIDGRSARYVAARIGISNSAFSDRLKGKAPFLADELELIAAVFKIEPVEFYAEYLSITAENYGENRIGNSREGEVIPFRPRKTA